MQNDEIVEQAERIIAESRSDEYAIGVLSQASDFLQRYAGERSAFYRRLSAIDTLKHSPETVQEFVQSTLGAFVRFVQSGLLDGVSLKRRAEIDVVSDFLGQAQDLLDATGVHPAAPAMIIGASLEEFLRNWVEEAGLSLGAKKPSLDAYSNTLREAEFITKQDAKDITSWAGTRNHAAHGEWDDVSDKRRVALMLEGVNLFMRRHGADPGATT